MLETAARQNTDIVMPPLFGDGAVNIGHDRLAHAQKYAIELNESRLREISAAKEKRWTVDKRAGKAQKIHTVKPWAHSTGPKSGPHAKGAGFQKRAFKSAMRQQNWFLRSVRPDSGQRAIAKSLGIVSSAALCLLLAMGGAEIRAFRHVTDRNNE